MVHLLKVGLKFIHQGQRFKVKVTPAETALAFD